MKKKWIYILPAILTLSMFSCGGGEENNTPDADNWEENERLRKEKREEEEKREAEEEEKREAEKEEKRKADSYETTIDAELTGKMKDYFSFEGKVKFGADYITNSIGEPIVKFKLVRSDKPFAFDMSKTYIKGGDSDNCPEELKFEVELLDVDGAPIDIDIEFPLYGGTKDLYNVEEGEDLWITSPDGFNDHLIVDRIVEQKENIKKLKIKTYIGENYAYSRGSAAYNKDDSEDDYKEGYEEGSAAETSEWIDEYAEILEEYLDIVSDIDWENPDITAISEITALEMKFLNLTQKIETANPSAQDLKRLVEIQAEYANAAAKMAEY